MPDPTAPYPIAIDCLTDNFAWLVANDADEAFVIDPGEALPIKRALDERGLRLTHILITHYHFDHIGGAAELHKDTGAEIWAPKDSIDPTHRVISDGEELDVCGKRLRVIYTPGHAFNHISLYCQELEALFSGDVLFALGCGRLFDGSAQEMWSSLKKLRGLPPQTLVCGGHDYLGGNLRFVNSLQGIGEQGKRLISEIEKAREKVKSDGKSQIGIGLPTKLGDEMKSNPFLLADDADFLKANSITASTDVEAFAEIRRRKDRS